MSKELPYWQFEPAEYLTKDVSFCSLSAQGLFINICSYYWQRDCELTQNQLIKRLNHPNEMEELIEEGVIDLEGDNIVIKFLDNQRDKAIETSSKNSINGKKGGRPKNPIKTEPKPNQKPILTEPKGIKGNKITVKDTILKHIKEDKIVLPFDSDKFINAFILWCEYRNEIGKKVHGGEIQIQGQLKKLSNLALINEDLAIQIINNCIESSWVGLQVHNTNDKKEITDESIIEAIRRRKTETY